MNVAEQENAPRVNPEHVAILSRAVASWYVRKDNKFYPSDRLTTKLSKEDVERACINRMVAGFPEIKLTQPLVTEVFTKTIVKRHTQLDQTMPVWDGTMTCSMGDETRYLRRDGAVSVNSWTKPTYRTVVPSNQPLDPIESFFDVIFTRAEEKAMFLDWLAWSLQNEALKPKWAPFLYSATKGSGKSTLCKLVAALFGIGNSVTQNNVDKLVSQFNMSVLQSKLVICEELNLKPGSAQGNTLKTYLTEEDALAERKGLEAERVKQSCCFLFTSNHLPLWIEPEDRRYYLIDVDHDGHAAGPNAEKFSALVGEVIAFLGDEAKVVALWQSLMHRKLSEGFTTQTLNIATQSTALMKRVQAATGQVVVDQLQELLDELGLNAISEADVVRLSGTKLHIGANQIKYMMTDLGWIKGKAKWGGVDYSRALWVQADYHAHDGKLAGPAGYEVDLAEHLTIKDYGLMD